MSYTIPISTRVLLIGGSQGGRILDVPWELGARVMVEEASVSAHLDLIHDRPPSSLLEYDLINLLPDVSDPNQDSVVLGALDGLAVGARLGDYFPATMLRLARDLGCVGPRERAPRWRIVGGRAKAVSL